MLTIYTDGSCWPNPSANGGWAFVVYQNGVEMLHMSGANDRANEPMTTNNRMEMRAMMRALMWLGPRAATIYSDSKYVVDGLNMWSRSWARNNWMRRDKATGAMVSVVNADLWEVLHVARMPQHRVHWVKGHAGEAGNERADALAEAARMEMAA